MAKIQGGRLPIELRVPSVRFVSEKNGKPEQLLKQRLAQKFEGGNVVQLAFLVTTVIGEQAGVALCLKANRGPDRDLVQEISVSFKEVFNANEHLDILFVNARQERELIAICEPFWSSKKISS